MAYTRSSLIQPTGCLCVRNKSYLSHLLHLVRYLTHDNYDYRQFCARRLEKALTTNAKGSLQHTEMPCTC